MAGPQFFTPPSVTPSRSKKHFTVAEANKSLPYVSRIVADLVATHQAALGLQDRADNQGSAKERSAAEKELGSAKDRFQCLIEELAVVGVELKDPESGLIDFVGRHKGHDVCLCWKLGEAKVSFFHEVDSGFAGRQPVSTLDETP